MAMVILGLGSNLGDRIQHLRFALHLLQKLQGLSVKNVSPLYISDALLPPNAPLNWNKPYLNLAIQAETALDPHDLLVHLKKIEQTIGRKPEDRWGPRIIDIDILTWENLILHDYQLQIPHKDLHERPFALWPLADLVPCWIYPLKGPWYGKTATEMASRFGSRYDASAAFHTQQIQHRIDTPALVGILNITPDSFSDGGQFDTTTSALTHFKKLAIAGTEIIDIGAESTRPGAEPSSAEHEWQRLEPILDEILSIRHQCLIPPKISIDTRHVATAEKVLQQGVEWINDVSGLATPEMCEIIGAHAKDVIVMHQLGIPPQKNKTLSLSQSPITSILEWATQKFKTLEKYHITPEKIIFDVGIGFGKTAWQSWEILKNISAFKSLGTRLMVGHSRKSFLDSITNISYKERDIETLILSLHLANHGIDYLRVHAIEETARAFKCLRALRQN